MKHYLKEHGPLSEALAASVLRQVAEGVKYLHDRDFIHRDLSDGNILITQITPELIVVSPDHHSLIELKIDTVDYGFGFLGFEGRKVLVPKQWGRRGGKVLRNKFLRQYWGSPAYYIYFIICPEAEM